MDEQIRCDKRFGGVDRGEGYSTMRHCGSCGNTGHNAGTCQGAVVTSSYPSSFNEYNVLWLTSHIS